MKSSYFGTFWVTLSHFEPRINLWIGQEMGAEGKNVFMFFFKSPFHGLSNSNEITILNERQFLVMLGPRTNIWAGQEVGGVSQNVFDHKTLTQW